ncbi:MAG: xanthine dehydrogenase family protein subunit M, partial [Proteobacteria bacterium]
MIDFSYSRLNKVDDAHKALTAQPTAKVVGGGTNLIDLIRSDVMHPRELIDINSIESLKEISSLANGGLRIGALVTNSDVAYSAVVESNYPLLAEAILAGASPQLRNMATTGGNLLQRTRCSYFYDRATPCNKREATSGCSARKGLNRMHAILGTSDSCIAVHPSDMCVALAALEATVEVSGPDGKRSIPFEDFHRLPGDRPDLDSNLKRDEIITSVDLPREGYPLHYRYLKIRDRSSYAFALVSVAVAIELDGSRLNSIRLALGGVAHKPWRAKTAEAKLAMKNIEDIDFSVFADEILAGAQGFGCNDFKIPLAKNAIIRAI